MENQLPEWAKVLEERVLRHRGIKSLRQLAPGEYIHLAGHGTILEWSLHGFYRRAVFSQFGTATKPYMYSEFYRPGLFTKTAFYESIDAGTPKTPRGLEAEVVC